MSLQYRREIVITNSDATEYTDYPVLITLNYYADYSGKVDANLYGFRFKDGDGNLLNHWVHPATRPSSTTRIFIKVPTIAASTTTTIYMYYGDLGLSSIESGIGTFDFYDELSGTDEAALDSTIWPFQYGVITYESDYSGIEGKGSSSGNPNWYTFTRQACLTRSEGVQAIYSIRTPNSGSSGYTDYTGCGFWTEQGYWVCACLGRESTAEKQAVGYYYGGWTKTASGGSADYSTNTWYYHRFKMDDSNFVNNYDFATGSTELTVAIPAGITSSTRCYPAMCGIGSGVFGSPPTGIGFLAWGKYQDGVSDGVVGSEENLGPIPETITPSYADQGQSLTGVEITGTGFDEGATVNLERSGESDIDATSVVVNSSTSITCNIAIGESETVGWWDLRITNP